MNNFDHIPDADERLRALDPATSFIVQAPAGSGKTGLLIQRYLRLLVCVDHPEEIIAITFTRKAAAEMRERILAALQMVQTESVTVLNNSNAFQRLTHELAIAVLKRDQLLGWRILENPARLKIQTIDSLCASLTQQMPVLSKFGSQPETVEDASILYKQAARATVELLNKDEPIASDLEHLFDHLDNDMDRIISLLVEMLARRDHWLRHIHGKTTREELEESLENLRRNAVEHVSKLFPAVLQNELLVLMRYAAANLIVVNEDSFITLCDGLETIPDTVEQWCGIAELLLTAEGNWRKQINKNQGFLPGKTSDEKETAKTWKLRIGDLIEQLADDDVLRQALQAMRQLPPSRYQDGQWRMLDVLTRLLPRAVAELKLIFQSSRLVDFSEVSQRAVQALGDSEMPTDLALTLDYKIRHLLIDEFQDTSISQFQLIEKLTAGWEASDGRSLFAVGDPMQSIYRFREAEVGLFLQARQLGIGQIKLQPITLSSNFRSQRGIVNWVNQTFQQVMPAFEDVAAGAVGYTPSFAVHEELADRAVFIHPIFGNDHDVEAQMVINVISQAIKKDPDGSIAILVRNRSHLSAIIELLKKYQYSFRAVDIDSLSQKPVVQDLLMLARALRNPVDRLAWLSVLRAPWCGMTLNDLQALVSIQANSVNSKSCKPCTIYELIHDECHWSEVSGDGVIRLRRIRNIISQCIQNRNRKTLRNTVESAWLALGGPGCVTNNTGEEISYAAVLNDAQKFFDYLERSELAGKISDWTVFEEGVTRLYAPADLKSDGRLQVMTIHKSKGLEFDTVLLPGLGNISRNKSRQLLHWLELPRNREGDDIEGLLELNETDLFLAPIQKTGNEADRISQWMSLLEQDKEDYETERLLYVAATRAKKHLHLLGHVNVSDKNGEKEIQKPRAGSLLGRLWPVVELEYVSKLSNGQFEAKKENQVVDKSLQLEQTIRRLCLNWKLPIAPQATVWKPIYQDIVIQEDIEYSWASEMARHVGNIVHRVLQQIADDELRGWDVKRIYSMRDIFVRGLRVNGFDTSDELLEQAVGRIILALTNILEDERGRWLLSKQTDAFSEFKLTGTVRNKVVNYVIDRTFCDSNDHRWIIDYKTSSHEGAGIESFLDREHERYSSQLNNYAEIFQKLDKRKIFLGLYFPLLKGWRSWEYK